MNVISDNNSIYNSKFDYFMTYNSTDYQRIWHRDENGKIVGKIRFMQYYIILNDVTLIIYHYWYIKTISKIKMTKMHKTVIEQVLPYILLNFKSII